MIVRSMLVDLPFGAEEARCLSCCLQQLQGEEEKNKRMDSAKGGELAYHLNGVDVL